MKQRKLIGAGEEYLTRWIADSVRITTFGTSKYEAVERQLLGTGMFPLNIKGNSHPFAAVVSRRRREAVS